MNAESRSRRRCAHRMSRVLTCAGASRSPPQTEVGREGLCFTLSTPDARRRAIIPVPLTFPVSAVLFSMVLTGALSTPPAGTKACWTSETRTEKRAGG